MWIIGGISKKVMENGPATVIDDFRDKIIYKVHCGRRLSIVGDSTGSEKWQDWITSRTVIIAGIQVENRIWHSL